MYEATSPDPNSPYWNSLVGTMENNFRSIYKEYFGSNKLPDNQLNGYGKKILSHINSIAPEMDFEELERQGILYESLALSYLSFYI